MREGSDERGACARNQPSINEVVVVVIEHSPGEGDAKVAKSATGEAILSSFHLLGTVLSADLCSEIISASKWMHHESGEINDNGGDDGIGARWHKRLFVWDEHISLALWSKIKPIAYLNLPVHAT